MAKVTHGLGDVVELFGNQELCDAYEIVEESDCENTDTYKTVATTSLVTLVSYMMGLDIEIMEKRYKEQNEKRIVDLRSERSATIIRYLSRLRTNLMLNFKKVDNEILYNLGNIDRMEYFSADEIKQLQKWGIDVVKTNTRADKYSMHFCKLIAANIDNCKKLFPDWVNFEYIRDLFVVQGYEKEDVLKNEFGKFMANINNYPFQMYINWTPGEYGNILSNDGKFLATIYAQHGDYFEDRTKYRDAKEDTKQNIYKYIEESERVAVVVDCENSDVYKLFGVLKNLEDSDYKF